MKIKLSNVIRRSLLVALFPLTCSAGQITVTTANNVVSPDANLSSLAALQANPGSDGVISLREAIVAANNGGGANTIVLQAGVTYSFARADVDNYWYGPNALPAIVSAITIEGNGATLQRTDTGRTTGDALRFFYVSGGLSGLPAGNLTLKNLTLSNGLAKGGNGNSGGMGAGGAIFNQGPLTLSGVTFTGNLALGGSLSVGGAGGGGIGQDCQSTGGGGFGGPVGNYGGHGSPAQGGGGFNDNAVGNLAGGHSGLGSGAGDGGDGSGNLTLGGNFGSGGQGGGLYTVGVGVLIKGGGGGVGGGGGFGGNGDGVAGGAGGFGGGAASSQGSGGGNGGFGGGGLSNGGFGGGNGGGGGAGMGGAVFSMYGTLNAINCTFAGNTAQGGDSFTLNFGLFAGGTGGSALGGAIFNLNGNANLVHCTLENNNLQIGQGFQGNGSSAGKALYNIAYAGRPDGTPGLAAVTLTNSILTDVVNYRDGTRIAGTSATVTATMNGAQPTNIVDVAPSNTGGVISGQFQLSQGQLVVDPAGLQNNGGPTPTIALPIGSIAVNAGIAASYPGTSNPVTTDQRGVLRDAAPDIGAVEQINSLVVTTATDEDNGDSDPAHGTGTSLREALAYANTLSGAQTITFSPALAGQIIVVSNGWNGASDDTALRVSGNVTVDGGTGVTIALSSPVARRTFLNGGTLTLRNLTLAGGNLLGANDGGALWSSGTATLDTVQFIHNQANNGGAVVSSGALTVRNCTFNGNIAQVDGGAIYSAGGTSLTIDNSTFFGNQTSGNSASAISSSAQQNTYRYLTIVDNNGGSGAIKLIQYPATMIDCIVAVNTPDGVITSNGGALSAQSNHNILGTGGSGGLTNGVNGNRTGVTDDQLLLGSFGSNGGPTQTMALFRGSPAINAGVTISGMGADQRGMTRGGASGGLRGRYYAVPAGASPSLLAPLDTLDALAPTAFAFTPRVDFGAGTETSPGDGSVLDRNYSAGNLLGGLNVNVGTTNIAAYWDGIITVPATAHYTFTTRSDDGSVLYIDGQLVVNNNNFQPSNNSSGTISLTAGPHTIAIGYFQGVGGATMQASWAQLDGTAPFARQIIPPGVLSYAGGAVGTAPDIGAYEFQAVPAAAPQVTPLNGTYKSGMTVTINNNAPDSTVYYTLDGSTPSATHGLVYTGPFTLLNSATVLAMSTGGGWLDSSTGSANLTVLSSLPYWRNLQGLNANGLQDFANPSGDGVANLLKYAFNMAPGAGDLMKTNLGELPENGTAGLPYIGIDAQGHLVIEFIRQKASSNPGIAYIVETGTVPGNLMEISLAGAAVVSIDSTWERVTVTDPAISARRFGRVRIQPLGVYFNNFNTALGAATLRGSASYTNQAVQLTDAVTGQLGAVTFDGLNLVPEVTGFTAQFNLQLGPTTSGGPADGASFAVGDLATAAWGEGGPATAHSIAVGFDTYDNGTGVQSGIGIHLWVNGVDVADNATNPYTNGQLVPVVISYDAATGLTLTFNGAAIFSNVPVSGFTFRTTDKFGLGARTGGVNERCVVDDVQIAPR